MIATGATRLDPRRKAAGQTVSCDVAGRVTSISTIIRLRKLQPGKIRVFLASLFKLKVHYAELIQTQKLASASAMKAGEGRNYFPFKPCCRCNTAEDFRDLRNGSDAKPANAE